MKSYRVSITSKAEADLREKIRYLKDVKKSRQAAQAVLDDYRETRKRLEDVAGIIANPDDEKLRERNLRRMNFQRHNYFLLYCIEGDCAIIVRIFHGLEDYARKL